MKMTTEELASVEELIKSSVEEACKNHPVSRPEDKATIEKALRSFLTSDDPTYKVLGIPDLVMEQYYALAYNLYNMGNYKDSLAVFRNIYPKDGLNPRYTFGIAACCLQLKNYEDAAVFFLFTAYLDQENPIPCYHLYDCYLQLNDLPAAAFALAMVLYRTENKKEYQKLYEVAEINFNLIKSKI